MMNSSLESKDIVDEEKEGEKIKGSEHGPRLKGKEKNKKNDEVKSDRVYKSPIVYEF
jgi:hypothetical protein